MAGRQMAQGVIVLSMMVGATLVWSRSSLAQTPVFTTDFMLQQCQFSARGQNPYFSLEPGRQLILAGDDDGERIRLKVTVLPETEVVDGVTTRVVEERESVNGELVEVSRNFFARCRPTNDIVYFGEDVDIYENGQIISHDGAWRAGMDNAQAGIIMPGRFLLGARYVQEQAPGVAEDRAQHVAMGLTMQTPAGTFTDCVKVRETTPLEPTSKSIKIYCPGVGLTVDDKVSLIAVRNLNRNTADPSDD